MLFIPGFILRRKDITSSKKFILATIWHAKLNNPAEIPTSITNKKLIVNSGLHCEEQTMMIHLKQLEEIGLIQRHGAHRRRILTILIEPDNSKGLTIPKAILSSNIGCTKKLVMAAEDLFRKEGLSPDSQWICETLGISPWSLWHSRNTKHPDPNPPTKPPKYRGKPNEHQKRTLAKIIQFPIKEIPKKCPTKNNLQNQSKAQVITLKDHPFARYPGTTSERKSLLARRHPLFSPLSGLPYRVGGMIPLIAKSPKKK